MQKNKNIFYLALFIGSLQMHFNVSVVASEKFANQLGTMKSGGCAMGKQIEEFAQAIGNVGTCVGFAASVYELGTEIHTFLNPTEERQNQIQKIHDELELINLRKNFVTCLVANRAAVPSKRFGIPSQCEYAAFLFGTAGAENEVERMVVAFKKYNQQ